MTVVILTKNEELNIVSVINDLENSPKTLANNTFFDNPITNLFTPSENVLYVVFLFDSSFSTVEYLTIGPAINCGNSVTYNANLKIFFCQSNF